MEEKHLDEFYYIFEDALHARSLVSENLEGLEHLSLNAETKDPYLLALYTRYGIFGPVNIKKAFKMLNAIEDSGYCTYEPWKHMKVPIRAFVAYQLSLFHLGYSGIDRDLDLAEDYLKDSIKLGHKLAMFDQAEEIMNFVDANNIIDDEINKALNLYKMSCAAGYLPAHISIVECYNLLNKFDQAAPHYDILINQNGFENLIPEFQREYSRAIKNNPEKKEYNQIFINVLMQSNSDKAASAILSVSNVITEDLIDCIFADSMSVAKFHNLLLIFNHNNLLYQKYITKLFKAFHVNKSIQSILDVK